MRRVIHNVLGRKLASPWQIPGIKVGRSWRFERQQIANWLKPKVEEQ